MEIDADTNKNILFADCTSPADTTVSIPYVDCRSTSSGTSDMSDYIETLSISSHSSSDMHSADALRQDTEYIPYIIIILVLLTMSNSSIGCVTKYLHFIYL